MFFQELTSLIDLLLLSLQNFLVKRIDIKSELKANVVFFGVRVGPEDVSLFLLVLFRRIFDVVEEMHKLFELGEEFSLGVFNHVSYIKNKIIRKTNLI